jgi:phospho-N-acetylmuramoyl-pentapeptide-transferase
MIPWIGETLLPYFGPFRLLTSRVLLIGLGACLAALLTWRLLPRLWHLLPRDHGRADAVAAEQSVGKPVGAGIIIMLIYAAVCLLVLPLKPQILELLECALLATAEGFFDDRSRTGWSEYRLGLIDLIVSVLGAAALCQLAPVTVWLPLLKAPFIVSPWVYIPVAAVLIWITINATNCTDGVDGLSGSLVLVSLFYLGIILYGILGNAVIARYLEVPHYPEAVEYGMMSLVLAGALAGYLWHNAHPSAVLMGDAGSRPLGFLLGALVLGSGNPILLIVVAGVVFINGATGLVKMALLRFLKIGIFRTVRLPLHDHARERLGWSNEQVLLRFVLLQAVGTPILLMLVLKVR